MSPHFWQTGKTVKNKNFLIFGGFSLSAKNNEASKNKLFSEAFTSRKK
jgi:hypothetical protein